MQNIRWIIQNNLILEKDLQAVKNACTQNNIEYELVEVIPFSSEIPNFTTDQKVNIYYGSTAFMYNIYNQLNKPKGLFFDDITFSIENYFDKWKESMLNYGSIVTTFIDFVKQEYDDDKLFFIRPDADDKSFSGEVKRFSEIKEWHKNFILHDNIILTDNTKIVVGEPYNIKKEWRNFIVDGKVISSSLYRTNFKLTKSGNDIPEDMIRFVEDRCIEYQPHKIFAMDIALCGNEYYIIECGCLNSVGFYDADIYKVITEISKYMSNN